MTTSLGRQEYALVIEAIDALHGNIEGGVESLARSRRLTNTNEFITTLLAEWETELSLLESAKEKLHAACVKATAEEEGHAQAPI